ncbi:response regulator transcription factor [Tabrizicola sp. WMC-M-20]|nr:response regulator transcription factor [Tabrizicola sp. WMC-M-20]
MHIYVFEPREDRCTALRREFAGNGVAPTFVAEGFFGPGLSALNHKGLETRPVLIADIATAQFDPLARIRAVRLAGCRNPLLVLRDARNAAATSQALDAGADDVMVLPLKTVELVARIRSITRRAYGHAAESVTVGEVTAFFDGRDPQISGGRLKLSSREHAIFQHLALNANRVISKGAIYDAIYGMRDDQPFDKVIDVYICKLRKKIAGASAEGRQYIETVPGRGYSFAAASAHVAVE